MPDARWEANKKLLDCNPIIKQKLDCIQGGQILRMQKYPNELLDNHTELGSLLESFSTALDPFVELFGQDAPFEEEGGGGIG